MYKYNDDTYDTLDDLIDAVTDKIEESDEMQNRYDVMLKECSGDGNGVNIAGLTYDAAYVLKEVDPIAYRCGYNDYINGYISDLRSMNESTILDELLNFGIDIEEIETEEIQGN